MSQNSIFFLVFVSSILGVFAGHKEIPENIPPEVEALYNSDLDTWEPPEYLKEKYPYYLSGYDYEGRPVWVVEFGQWNLRKVLGQGKDAIGQFDKYCDQLVLFIFNSTYSKHEILPAIVIMDMDNYALSQLTSPPTIAFVVEKLKLIVVALRNAKTGYFINTNFFAERLLILVKPLLGKEFEKLEIFGTNPAKWKPQLLRTIPSNQLPKRYGGSADFKPVMVYG